MKTGEYLLQEVREQDSKHLWHPWTPFGGPGISHLPLYVSGSGCHVFDAEGKKYLDATSAALNASLGYGRADIVSAVSEQMSRLMTFELAGASTVPPIQLATKIADLLPPSLTRTFFCSSGSEATETAIKMVRLYHRLRGEFTRNLIVGFRGGYHGATCGALALSSSAFNQQGYDPALTGFVIVDHPSGVTGMVTPSEEAIARLERVLDAEGPNKIAGVVIEPILGIGGVRIPPDNYLKLLRQLCDRYGILLIFDEVLTGFGRTGRLFALEHWDVVPDIILLSKCLTGGYVPLSAITTTDDIYTTFSQDPLLGGFRHGHTNSGHAAACTGALAVIAAIENERLVQNSAIQGKFLLDGLRSITATSPDVSDVRGLGLLIAIEFAADDDGTPLATRFAKGAAIRGLLVRQQENIVTLAPPLIITTSECGVLLTTVGQVFESLRR
jgi:adenosylmethionine-8-amino-7-oxononanoate aminotransferase